MKILLTGHAGFVGFHLIHELLQDSDCEIIGIDNFSSWQSTGRYAARLSSYAKFLGRQLKSIRCDFSNLDALKNEVLHLAKGVDFIIHNGAESHVPRSYDNPEKFLLSNSQGTFNMLELARILRPRKFLYTSTDEVFGSSLIPHPETDMLNPSNIYSASKASGEMWVKAFHLSFGVQYIITRTTNMYGEHQDTEKFVKMAFEKIWNHEIVDIHTNSAGQIGSRQWTHALNQAKFILFLLTGPFVNDTIHLAGERRNNLEIAQFLADKVVGKPLRYQMVDAYKRWPGHDLHYALDDTKIRKAGFSPSLTLEQGLMLPL